MTLIQMRGGTAAAWTSVNPVLASREMGVETDTLKFKMGNGSTAWNSLAYSGDDKVPSTRAVAAGTGLAGGGDLSANRTLTVSYGSAANTACQGNDARLSDTRTPSAGSVTAAHIAGATLATAAEIAAANDDVTIPTTAALKAYTPPGSGTGDASTNTSASVDGEVVLFSGTAGKTLKRATATGLMRLTAGVQGVAAAGTDFVAPGGTLGTPASGTLTNCGGLPVTGIAASTSAPLGIGSLDVGHASDTTVTRSEAGLLAVEGVIVPTITGAKRISVVTTLPPTPDANTVYIINDGGAPRVTTITTSLATPIINTDLCDAVTIPALTTAITSMTTNLTPVVTGPTPPKNFQPLMIRIRDNGTARTIAWGAAFENGTATLPLTTVAGKTLLVSLIFDSVDAKWACEAQGSRA